MTEEQRLEKLDAQTANGNYICDDCGKKITEFFDCCVKKNGKVVHAYPMISLNDAFDKETVVKWEQDIKKEVAQNNIPQPSRWDVELKRLWQLYPSGVISETIYSCRNCFDNKNYKFQHI